MEAIRATQRTQRDQLRGRTASTAAAAGSASRGAAAPRIAPGPGRATATTSASASFAPQDRADEGRSRGSEPAGKAVPRSGMRGTRKLPGGERR